MRRELLLCAQRRELLLRVTGAGCGERRELFAKMPPAAHEMMEQRV